MTLHLELGRSRWWVGVLAAALAMLLGTNGISRAAQAVPPTQTWVATHTRAHPVSDLVAEGPASGNESLDIVVTLHPSNEQQLPTLLADRVNRQSPLFRAWLTHDEVMAKFTPAPQDAQQVVAYLRSQGFTNVEVADGNFLVSATGSSAAVQRAFNTTLTRFRRPDQSVGLANTTAAFVSRDARHRRSFSLGAPDGSWASGHEGRSGNADTRTVSARLRRLHDGHRLGHHGSHLDRRKYVASH